jgi:16S rRNA processing protein RimM
LIGLAAVDPAKQPVGEIVGVENYGAGDLIEVRLAKSGKTELVPFTDANVPSIDLAARCAVIVLPATAEAKGAEEEE